MAFVLKIFFLFFLPVVIPIQHIKSLLLVKLSHQPELVAVYPHNLLQIPVFLQLVSVPQFDVNEISPVIILQCGEKKILVRLEVIAPVANSPVAVAHQNDAAAHVDRQAQRPLISLVQPFFCASHDFFFSQAILPVFVMMAKILGYASIR